MYESLAANCYSLEEHHVHSVSELITVCTTVRVHLL